MQITLLRTVVPAKVTLLFRGFSAYLTCFYHKAMTPEPQTPGPSFHTPVPGPEFMPIVVHIEYSLRNPVDGIQFVLPTDAYPYVSTFHGSSFRNPQVFQRVPHAYTTPSSPDAARCWVPCIDNLWERCTWEFEFVVPRYLEEPDPSHRGENGDFEETQESTPTVVVCSGDLVEQACGTCLSHPAS